MAPITINNVTPAQFTWIHSQLSGRPGAKVNDAPKTSDGISSGSVSGNGEALSYSYTATTETLVLRVTHHRLLDLPAMVEGAIRHNIQQIIATMPANNPTTTAAAASTSQRSKA